MSALPAPVMATSPEPLRVLVVTRSYPEKGDLYKYPFVHRRVLAYRSAGHELAIFRPAARTGDHEFEGVRCRSGDRSDLKTLAADWKPHVIAVHGFSEALWETIEPLSGRFPIRAWLHGSEIPAIARFKASHDGSKAERASARAMLDSRIAFWRQFLASPPDRFQLVFVSRAAAQLALQDMGADLQNWAVIHNPIDSDLFTYAPKPAEQRFNILMIRPFDSFGYGNDMAVKAILEMSRHSQFEQLSFTIFGDGPMFDSTLAPLRGLANVQISRQFLTQAEIADQHRRHGIFLVPTRIDTQGVSRDEAMSSGLVPVTNSVGAIPEFVDDRCSVLAPAEDAFALARGMWDLVEDAGLFADLSAAAAARVRRQSGKDRIIPQELALLEAAANG